MSILRRLNNRLAATTGYAIRRAARTPESATAKAAPARGDGDAPAKKAALASWRPPEDPETDRLLRRPVFIISPVRSGSTLLRMLLGAHSQLHAPHELHVRRLEVGCSTRLAERSMEQLGLDRGDLEHLLWDRVMHRELVRSGKDFIVEKTPSNAFAYQRLSACWPDARFVFLLRHPASVAASWHEADPVKRTEEEAALDALRYMRATERARKALPGHTVRYEDLTENPEVVLKELCAFLEVPYEPGMADYGRKGDDDLQKGLGDWKEKIRTGRVQSGRELPTADEIPGPLREISTAWGYVEAARPAAAKSGAGHAEIAEVWPREGRIRVVGDVHGRPVTGSGTWRLVLKLRDSGSGSGSGNKADPADSRQLSYDAPLDGTRFDVAVPVSDLDGTGGDGSEPALWDVYLATGSDHDAVLLRAGRHLDGVKDKKHAIVFPTQTTGQTTGQGTEEATGRGSSDDTAADGSATQVKPYYTVKNNLSVECFTALTPDDLRAAP